MWEGKGVFSKLSGYEGNTRLTLTYILPSSLQWLRLRQRMPLFFPESRENILPFDTWQVIIINDLNLMKDFDCWVVESADLMTCLRSRKSRKSRKGLSRRRRPKEDSLDRLFFDGKNECAFFVWNSITKRRFQRREKKGSISISLQRHISMYFAYYLCLSFLRVITWLFWLSFCHTHSCHCHEVTFFTQQKEIEKNDERRHTLTDIQGFKNERNHVNQERLSILNNFMMTTITALIRNLILFRWDWLSKQSDFPSMPEETTFRVWYPALEMLVPLDDRRYCISLDSTNNQFPLLVSRCCQESAALDTSESLLSNHHWQRCMIRRFHD